MMSGPPGSLKVVTLNIWGLGLGLASKRAQRVWDLCEFLSNPAKHDGVDVVLLQEVWVGRDARLLASAAREGGLPFSVHFQSGVFGSGLVTLSRFPITSHFFHRYSSSGDAAAVFCGDYYAAKGVGWARITTPSGDVDVFNTHLHANYSHKYSGGTASASSSSPSLLSMTPPPPKDDIAMPPEWAQVQGFKVPEDGFAPFRVSQVVQLAHIVSHLSGSTPLAPPSASGGRPSPSRCIGTVLGGDLNCQPDSLEFQLLRLLLPRLQDSWALAHAHDPTTAALGHTCKAAGNSFAPRRQVPQRIDYVLSDLGLRQGGARIVLTTTPEGYSYSDHFGVEAKLALSSASGGASAGASGKGRPAASSSSIGAPVPSASCEGEGADVGGSGEDASVAPVQAGGASAGPERGAVMAYAQRALARGAGDGRMKERAFRFVGLVLLLQGLALCVFTPWAQVRGIIDNQFLASFTPFVTLAVGMVGTLLALLGGLTYGAEARVLRQALASLQGVLAPGEVLPTAAMAVWGTMPGQTRPGPVMPLEEGTSGASSKGRSAKKQR